MAAEDRIRISGAREHNLKDISLELPRDALIVITGLSGSGKSSLAFDTIYAEGQRRYVESLSAYARQFLGQMDKPDVDSIEGLSPAISIDQKTTSRNPRSTVGTVTEIYDYLRLLWARIGHPHCHSCGAPIAGQSVEQIVDHVMTLDEGTRFMVLAPVVRGRKGEYKDLLEELRAEGYTRAKIDGELRRLEDEIELDKKYKHDIAVVVDRLQMKPDVRKRLADSVETAVALAEGIVEVELVDDAGSGESKEVEAASHRREGRARVGGHARLLREVLLPQVRDLDAGAGAPDLLVQLAARRMPALHGARVPDGDRPRPGGRPQPHDQRGRDPAVELGRRLLRAARAGDRREVRDRPRRAVGGHGARRTRTSSCTARRASASTSRTATGWDAGARTWRRSRASCTGLERRYLETDSEYSRERIEEYMSVRPCPECHGARLRPETLAVQGRRARDPRVHAQVGARGDRLARRAGAERAPSARSRHGS